MPGLRTAPPSWTSVVPGRVAAADGREGARAVGHDPGHRGERLDVVDDRGLAPQALPRGVRRSLVGLGAPVLEGAQQDGLLAHDEASPVSSPDLDRGGDGRARAASAPR